MKRTCNGCRALANVNSHYSCELGYKVEQKTTDGALNIGAIPQEECPKPKQQIDYLRMLHAMKRH